MERRDERALGQLVPIVYDELRQQAERHMAPERWREVMEVFYPAAERDAP